MTDSSFSKQDEGKEPRSLLIHNSTDRVSYSGKLLALLAGSMSTVLNFVTLVTLNFVTRRNRL